MKQILLPALIVASHFCATASITATDSNVATTSSSSSSESNSQIPIRLISRNNSRGHKAPPRFPVISGNYNPTTSILSIDLPYQMNNLIEIRIISETQENTFYTLPINLTIGLNIELANLSEIIVKSPELGEYSAIVQFD